MKYAYIDEYGAFGFKFEKSGCSTSMILSAIIVDEKDLSEVEKAAEIITKEYFGNGEMKSKSVGRNHPRRIEILNELMKLPFKVYIFVIDKTMIYDNCGPRYKPTFYKFFDSKIYSELCNNYREITIYADNVGGSEYIKEFSAYVRKKLSTKQLTLFDDHRFFMNDSKKNHIIQIADIISGSLAYTFDGTKKPLAEGNDYLQMLINNKKVIAVKKFPHSYDSYSVESRPEDESYEHDIARICYRRALSFLKQNENSTDDDLKMQVITLKYLLFRFVNNRFRKFISTKELISNLKDRGFENINTTKFRTAVIGKLRDADVIISSNSKGYKIPATKSELYDYVNFEQSIILPIVARLVKSRNLLYEGTEGNFDLFARDEYKQLVSMLGKQLL